MTFKVKDGLSVAGNTIIDGSGNVTVPGKITTSDTTTTRASLNLGTGTADPTTPAAGDLWYNAGAIKVRQAAATKVVAYTDSNITGTASNVTNTVANATTAASCSGNSLTATTLQNARTINGVSFNGSANITVAAAAGTLTGTALASGVISSSLTSVGTLSSLATSGAALLNGAAQISGSNTALGIAYSGATTQFGITLKPAADNSTVMNVFNAAGTAVGSITQSSTAISFNGNATSSSSCSGNAATATTLQTARTINGVAFNGSADITISAASAQTLTRGTYLTGANYNGSLAATWAVDADTANTASKIVARDASGNFSAGTITAALTGSATQLGGIAAASYVRTDTAQSITARKTFSGNQASVMATATGSLGAFEVYGDGTNAAFMAFHRPGAFAAYLGVDTDNVLKYGGWSVGASASPIVLSNGASWNISVSGSSASCTGNSLTATTLQTARAINGVSFNGSAAITITAATPNSLSAGSYISGSAFNGSSAQTWNVNAATASTVSTVVARDGAGDINVRLVKSEYINEVYCSGGLVFRVNNTTDNYLRTCSDVGAIRTFIGAYAASNPSGYTSNVGTVTGVSASAPVVSSGGTAPQISMAAASSGVNGYMTGAYATKLDGIAANATNVSNTNQLTNGAGYITSSGRAYPRRSDGGSIDFYYSGQSGQPTYVWGTGDGTNMYVWNPSNFNVNYATSSGSSNSCAMSSGRTDASAYPVVWGTSGATSQLYSCSGVTITSSSGRLYATYLDGSRLGVENTTGTNGAGISLYGGASAGEPTYGIMFQQTGTFGTHGSVTGDWATYFNMNNTVGRGWIFRNSTGDANVASITISGTAVFNGNVTAYSDERIKTDIQVIDNAIEKIKQLRGVTYKRTDDETLGRQTGVIAQEVLKVLPEAVMGSEDTTYSVAYGNMVGILIEAIKELNDKVNSLQDQLNSK